MKYDKDSIERRIELQKSIKKVAKSAALIIILIILYNMFLLMKSEMSNNKSKGFLGYKAYIIITDSMKPAIKSGDVIIIRKCSEKDLRIGDIITYILEDEIVTHRIVQIITEGYTKAFVTKGDNNNIEDSQRIGYESIEGRKILTIPGLGKFILVFENRMLIILIVIIILTMGLYIRRVESKKRMRREKKKIEEKKAKSENENN